MNQFWTIMRLEFRMSVMRKSMWLANALVVTFYIVSAKDITTLQAAFHPSQIWIDTALFAFIGNLFMPVIAGIVAADRLARDERLRVKELMDSTPLQRWTLIGGKYTGVLLSVLIGPFVLVMALSVISFCSGASWMVLPAGLLAFLIITLPAMAFVVAFSLICPLVIPLRVYQVLFTGYWFWGNALSSEYFPTLNGTWLTPSGIIALHAFYGWQETGFGKRLFYSPVDLTLNWVLILACALAILVAGERYMAWRAQRA